ncbi:hypothetical protein CBP51_06230 [Cellvibrio mixtus]|jgi:uncharacterized membrane protein YkoI|uniref:PepSY domain-containing protein n=1 Tax=Cellvibrio mixtus TaxID=39650 RepID=A0A266Q9N6_9GAMM|nr:MULTISPECIES: PepSY domain-containing protein [Cellvibrio]AQT62066.1 hypothetical protein B0D95_19580 [Cellvibrio sp. PSBB023]OZY86613.1 hypothetical protein CBP51_06230 [Cellvibrio mixtus]
MLQSKTSRTTSLVACRQVGIAIRHALSAALSLTLLASLVAFADPSLLDGDMGMPSSAPDNSLIDSKSISADPVQPKLSPAQAAALVRAKVGGQVMSVNSQRSESGVIYGVKVLNDGRMRVINVDGQTGQLLNQ